ncbi:hypothetical protein L9F63_024280 [Diploptera punctata]|uniref:Synaptotagmin SMP domain-containing protein n=1 Tax=Diploptera punctata TaxID=6984 RepID=A0AAD8E7V7_DIPPU|nr:hypothetical protein L9F63_024280 [Diploptera punctata]
MLRGRKLRLRKNNVKQTMESALQVSIGHIKEQNIDATDNKTDMKGSNRLKCIALCSVRRLFALLGAFLLGYYSCSIAWIFLIALVIVVLKDHAVQKRIKQTSITKTETKVDLEERTDWLNQMMTQMWPHVLNHMCTKMREEVEANIRATLDKYKLGGNFHFKRMHIGPSPLRLSLVEVLQGSPPGEMVICADIVYESNCDVTFVWRGIKGGMQDFQMYGRAHLGVGHFLDIPGLREIVNHIITKRISNLISDGTTSELENGMDYQRLIETLEKQDEIYDPEKCENEFSISNKVTSNRRKDSAEETHIADNTDIKYNKLLDDSEQDNLSKPETPTPIPSTPEVILRRGPTSVSSTTGSDHYNPIPKPSRTFSVNSNHNSTLKEDLQRPEDSLQPVHSLLT